jgi:curli biogenesis system outer membrane secretion channel CsgG
LKQALYKTSPFALIAIMVTVALGQTPPAAAPAAPAAAPKRAAAPKAASPVDSVIQLVKAGMSEDLIVKSLKKTNKSSDLSPADMVKLKQAGVSDNIIGVMIDPSSAPAPAAAAAVAPPPPPPPAPAPTPAAAPAPVASSAPAPPPAPTGATSQAEKKRVIVDEFDYSTVKTSVQAVFNTQADIGKGIRAMLVKRMADANKVVVVERAKVDQLMSEQDRNASNRVKQGSGARVGRISGADAVLAGDIVVFGRDDKKTNIGAGGFARGPFAGIHIKKEEDKAVVVIDYRLVDAETSEVIATGEARGESVRKSNGFGGMGGVWGAGGGGGGIDMTSSNFGQTIIGEATQDCVNKLGDILSQQATTMKKTVREVETRVADVSGSTMVIAAGGNDGVNVGETFEILKVLREVRDPTTKEVLDTVTEKAGDMTITSVRDKVATGNYVGKPAAVGFIARKKLPGAQ